jgi:hypothetical protein
LYSVPVIRNLDVNNIYNISLERRNPWIQITHPRGSSLA